MSVEEKKTKKSINTKKIFGLGKESNFDGM